MRVLHLGKFFPPYPGGIEVFLKELASQQQATGVSPAVLVHAPPGQHEGNYEANFPIYSARTWGTLAYAPISPSFGWMLRQAASEFKPDVLHFHLPNVSAFWALTSSLARRVPWVAHWHSDVLTEDPPWQIKASYGLYHPFEKALLRRSRTIIATSDNYRDASPVLQQFLPKSTVIPLGLNPTRYQQRDDSTDSWASELFGEKFRILALGRLSHYKGFSVLIEALKHTSGMRCVIAGDGEQSALLRAQAAQSGDKIHLCGRVTDSQALSLMQATDVIVMPSLQRTEAFGLVLLEAMIAGKPVIASDLPGSGMPWVVAQGGHGVLVPPGDSIQLTEALEKLQQNPDLRRQLGTSGHAAFERHFHIAAIEKQIREVYESITAGAD